MRVSLVLAVVVVQSFSAVVAQTTKDVRSAGREGSSGIPKLTEYLKANDVDVRIEAVKQLTSVGGKDAIAPLLSALHDPDAEVKIRATDALVNFYLPGYIKQGLGSSLRRVGSSIKARFTDENDQIIDAFVIVRSEVITGIGLVARSTGSIDARGNVDVRANAARAVGILRGDAALPDLYEALRSKDSGIMYESLIAIQKIRNPEAGPHIIYLLRDLDDRVQSAALETVGLLRTREALPTLRAIAAKPRNSKAERAAVASIAYMPEPADRAMFSRYLSSKDDKLRAAAAEGLGRANDKADDTELDKFWQDEQKMLPRLASAFALVVHGRLQIAEASPLQYLLNTLNSGNFHFVAEAYLEEAARRNDVRSALYGPLAQGTRDERMNLAKVLAASGDTESVPHLEKLSRDNDKDVAQEGLRALRSLKARLRV